MKRIEIVLSNIKLDDLKKIVSNRNSFKKVLKELGFNDQGINIKKLREFLILNKIDFINLLERRRGIIWEMDSDLFKNIVESSRNYTEILEKLGLTIHGGNIRGVKDRIEKEKLNINFDSSKRRTVLPLKDLLVENRRINNQGLKKRLIKEGVLLDQCSKCKIGSEWEGLPITLQLDHINGINTDNRLQNLRILCPNCHSQTDTFSGKNNKKEKKLKVCKEQKERPSKIKISKEELTVLVWNKPLTILAKEWGTTDNGIRKKCKKLGVLLPKRGYWQKIKREEASKRRKGIPLLEKRKYNYEKVYDKYVELKSYRAVSRFFDCNHKTVRRIVETYMKEKELL